MSEKLKTIANHHQFRHSITGIIVLASILVGLETYPNIKLNYHYLINPLEITILSIFIVEMGIRIGAYGRKPLMFFTNGWNVFDFVIVILSVAPADAEYLAVLRLARILRVLRLITALPRLQLLVGVIIKSIPSIGYITLLMMLVFYIYGCIGTTLFRHTDPIHFGSLHRSILTLFEIVTLEGWTELMHIQLYGSPDNPGAALPSNALTVIFFLSFILIGTMIVLNLFIGVIMTGMSEMHDEARYKVHKGDSNLEELDMLRDHLKQADDLIANLQNRIKD